jgi:uncharacterized membrane protein (DUF4010 family)
METIGLSDQEIFRGLAVALGLGLLVGLQRQWATDEIAGIRTFPMITLLGAIAALLSVPMGTWVVAGGLLGLAAILIMANVARIEQDAPSPGITTEAAALVMYLVGVAIMVGYVVPGVVVAGVVTVLLHWKAELHAVVRKMGQDEARAVMRLVLIALVVLPVLPNRTFGPLGVLNPFEIWLMVVLIVGISLAAYVAYRVFGGRTGTFMAGVLGGLISSTATAVSLSTATRKDAMRPRPAAVVIMLASTIVFVRVLVEIGIVHPAFLPTAAPPLLLVMTGMLLIAARGYLAVRNEPLHVNEGHAPSDLKAAVVFGLLYGVILFAVALAKDRLGDQALYAVAGISGLTDMDAITLSVTQLVQDGQLEAAQGWRLILVGGMANLVFKGGAVFLLGNRELRRQIVLLFGLSIAVGAAVLALW